jgi:GxxExxY protein
MEIDDITGAIIGAAIEVHRELGPGLLESAYEECLCHEMTLRELPFDREHKLPVNYKGVHIALAYRIDFVVAKTVIIELKAVAHLLPVHDAQVLSYLRLGHWPVGLLINFNVPILKQGIRRLVLGLSESNKPSASSASPR